MKRYFSKPVSFDKKFLYNELIDLGYSKYKTNLLLFDIYSFFGKIEFKPFRANAMVFLRKKNLLDFAELESSLESLVN